MTVFKYKNYNKVQQNFSSYIVQYPLLYQCIKSIILFGSRARDDWDNGSDWDILITVRSDCRDKKKDIKTLLYNLADEIMFKDGEFIQFFFKVENDKIDPFLKENIKKDGIALLEIYDGKGS